MSVMQILFINIVSVTCWRENDTLNCFLILLEICHRTQYIHNHVKLHERDKQDFLVSNGPSFRREYPCIGRLEVAGILLSPTTTPITNFILNWPNSHQPSQLMNGTRANYFSQEVTPPQLLTAKCFGDRLFNNNFVLHQRHNLAVEVVLEVRVPFHSVYLAYFYNRKHVDNNHNVIGYADTQRYMAGRIPRS